MEITGNMGVQDDGNKKISSQSSLLRKFNPFRAVWKFGKSCYRNGSSTSSIPPRELVKPTSRHFAILEALALCLTDASLRLDVSLRDELKLNLTPSPTPKLVDLSTVPISLFSLANRLEISRLIRNSNELYTAIQVFGPLAAVGVFYEVKLKFDLQTNGGTVTRMNPFLDGPSSQAVYCAILKKDDPKDLYGDLYAQLGDDVIELYDALHFPCFGVKPIDNLVDYLFAYFMSNGGEDHITPLYQPIGVEMHRQKRETFATIKENSIEKGFMPPEGCDLLPRVLPIDMWFASLRHFKSVSSLKYIRFLDHWHSDPYYAMLRASFTQENNVVKYLDHLQFLAKSKSIPNSFPSMMESINIRFRVVEALAFCLTDASLRVDTNLRGKLGLTNERDVKTTVDLSDRPLELSIFLKHQEIRRCCSNMEDLIRAIQVAGFLAENGTLFGINLKFDVKLETVTRMNSFQDGPAIQGVYCKSRRKGGPYREANLALNFMKLDSPPEWLDLVHNSSGGQVGFSFVYFKSLNGGDYLSRIYQPNTTCPQDRSSHLLPLDMWFAARTHYQSISKRSDLSAHLGHWNTDRYYQLLKKSFSHVTYVCDYLLSQDPLCCLEL